MNMSQLIEELSERTGYHPHDTDRVVRIFFDSIKTVSYTHLTLPTNA